MRDETTSVKAELRSDLSDGELMNRLGRGDSHALGEIYQRYVGVVRTALTRSAPELPRAQREELTQDVFVALLEQARRYRDEERLRAFLYGISVRKARMWRRQTWLRQHLLLRHQDLPVGMAARPQGGQVESLAARQDVMQALSHLPEAQREVLLLHAEGFSGEEIADQLHIRPKTVWTRLHRARVALVALALLSALMVVTLRTWRAQPMAARSPGASQPTPNATLPSAPLASTNSATLAATPRSEERKATAALPIAEPASAPTAAPTPRDDLRAERLTVWSAAHEKNGPKLSEKARERTLSTRASLDAVRKQVIAGELESAETVLRAHLALHANDATAWSLLGDCLRKASRWTDAVTAYRQVLRTGKGPELERARFLATSVLQDRLHDPRGVITLLDGYDSTHLMAPEATVRLARAWLEVGDKARAERLLQTVVDARAPNHVAEEAARILRSLRASAP